MLKMLIKPIATGRSVSGENYERAEADSILGGCDFLFLYRYSLQLYGESYIIRKVLLLWYRSDLAVGKSASHDQQLIFVPDSDIKETQRRIKVARI